MRNMKGYSLVRNPLALRGCAPRLLVGAQTFFQTQPARTQERSVPKGMIQRSRQMYRVSKVFTSSAIFSAIQSASLSLNNRQYITRIDRLPFGDIDLGDLARLRRLHFVLHLHRFDDQHALMSG